MPSPSPSCGRIIIVVVIVVGGCTSISFLMMMPSQWESSLREESIYIFAVVYISTSAIKLIVADVLTYHFLRPLLASTKVAWTSIGICSCCEIDSYFYRHPARPPWPPIGSCYDCVSRSWNGSWCCGTSVSIWYRRASPPRGLCFPSTSAWSSSRRSTSSNRAS